MPEGCGLPMEPLRGRVQRVQRRRIATEGGNDYNVSVTGLPSRCLNHAKHSAELATGVATPYPATPDSLHGKASHVIFGSLSLPYKSRSLATLFRGENRLLNAFLLSLVAQCSAPIVPPEQGERWCRQPPKGVLLFLRAAEAVV